MKKSFNRARTLGMRVLPPTRTCCVLVLESGVILNCCRDGTGETGSCNERGERLMWQEEGYNFVDLALGQTGVLCGIKKAVHTSHITRHTPHATRHTPHATRHTPHATRHTSHATRHTSHVTRHTPHVTRHICHKLHATSPWRMPWGDCTHTHTHTCI